MTPHLRAVQVSCPLWLGAFAVLENIHALVRLRLTRITNAGLLESCPYDVIIVKEAPNHQLSQR